jgi:hypothetical protein
VSLGGFRHPKGEDDQRQHRGDAEREKCRVISELIDNLPGSQPTDRGTDPHCRSDRALRQVVASGAACVSSIAAPIGV